MRMRYGRREVRGPDRPEPGALETAIRAVDEALAGDAELGRLSAPRLLERLDLDPLAREGADRQARDLGREPGGHRTGGRPGRRRGIGDEDAPSVAGGNQRLADGLARRLGSSIRLKPGASDRAGARM